MGRRRASDENGAGMYDISVTCQIVLFWLHNGIVFEVSPQLFFDGRMTNDDGAGEQFVNDLC